MTPFPFTRHPAPSPLKWMWWWSLAQLAEAAVAIRSRLIGLPGNHRPLPGVGGAAAGRATPLSPKWGVLAFAGLAAYAVGILLGLILR
ncbi:MAG: hypothetical protein ACRDHY_12085, partial [Anaerolineales bacterium]